MRIGLVILNVAALVWLAAAMAALDAPLWAYVLPVALSAAIGAFCLSRVHDEPLPESVARRVGRAVGLWSALEAVLIAIAVAVLVNLGQPWLIAPVVAAIVGLHFMPIARALNLPLYYGTGAGLILVASAALILPGPTLATAGIGAAIVLYATSFGLTLPPPPASPASPRR